MQNVPLALCGNSINVALKFHCRTLLHADNAIRFQPIERNWNGALLIVYPPREPLDTALSLRAVGCMLGNSWQIGSATAQDAAGQPRQGVQMSGQIPL